MTNNTAAKDFSVEFALRTILLAEKFQNKIVLANAFDSKWKLILNYQKEVSGLAISEFSHT